MKTLLYVLLGLLLAATGFYFFGGKTVKSVADFITLLKNRSTINIDSLTEQERINLQQAQDSLTLRPDSNTSAATILAHIKAGGLIDSSGMSTQQIQDIQIAAPNEFGRVGAKRVA